MSHEVSLSVEDTVAGKEPVTDLSAANFTNPIERETKVESQQAGLLTAAANSSNGSRPDRSNSRGDLSDEFGGATGGGSGELGEVDHRDQLADPDECADQVLVHAVANRSQLSEILLARLLMGIFERNGASHR